MVNPEQIIKELKKLDSKLLTAIEKILGKNPSQEQLLQFLSSSEFDRLIDELGLRKTIENYVKGFDFQFAAQLQGFATVDLKALQIERISRNLNLIKNSYGRTILGYAKAHTELLRSKLISSIVEGVTVKETINQLKNIPLTTAQLGAVVNTSYADYSRSVTAQVYQDKPEQRFKYVGGVIPTSSDECKWLMENQKPEGYTRAEIDAGIETPFTYSSGEFQGEVKKIYWFGRLPNYNCGHQFLPI